MAASDSQGSYNVAVALRATPAYRELDRALTEVFPILARADAAGEWGMDMRRVIDGLDVEIKRLLFVSFDKLGDHSWGVFAEIWVRIKKQWDVEARIRHAAAQEIDKVNADKDEKTSKVEASKAAARRQTFGKGPDKDAIEAMLKQEAKTEPKAATEEQKTLYTIRAEVSALQAHEDAASYQQDIERLIRQRAGELYRALGKAIAGIGTLKDRFDSMTPGSCGDLWLEICKQLVIEHPLLTSTSVLKIYTEQQLASKRRVAMAIWTTMQWEKGEPVRRFALRLRHIQTRYRQSGLELKDVDLYALLINQVQVKGSVHADMLRPLDIYLAQTKASGAAITFESTWAALEQADLENQESLAAFNRSTDVNTLISYVDKTFEAGDKKSEAPGRSDGAGLQRQQPHDDERFDKNCYYCGIRGHRKAECRKLQADIAAGRVDKRGRPSDGSAPKAPYNNWTARGGGERGRGRGNGRGGRGRRDYGRGGRGGRGGGNGARASSASSQPAKTGVALVDDDEVYMSLGQPHAWVEEDDVFMLGNSKAAASNARADTDEQERKITDFFKTVTFKSASEAADASASPASDSTAAAAACATPAPKRTKKSLTPHVLAASSESDSEASNDDSDTLEGKEERDAQAQSAAFRARAQQRTDWLGECLHQPVQSPTPSRSDKKRDHKRALKRRYKARRRSQQPWLIDGFPPTPEIPDVDEALREKQAAMEERKRAASALSSVAWHDRQRALGMEMLSAKGWKAEKARSEWQTRATEREIRLSAHATECKYLEDEIAELRAQGAQASTPTDLLAMDGAVAAKARPMHICDSGSVDHLHSTHDPVSLQDEHDTPYMKSLGGAIPDAPRVLINRVGERRVGLIRQTGVYRAPIKYNITSQSRLGDAGYVCVSDDKNLFVLSPHDASARMRIYDCLRANSAMHAVFRRKGGFFVYDEGDPSDVLASDLLPEVSFARLQRVADMHARMGHVSYNTIRRMVSEGMARDGLEDIDFPWTPLQMRQHFPCYTCAVVKAHKPVISAVTARAQPRASGEHYYIDLSGKITLDDVTDDVRELHAVFDNWQYYDIMVDVFDKTVQVQLFADKESPPAWRQAVLTREAARLGRRTLNVTMDKGGENKSSAFTQFCSAQGISIDYTPTNHKEQLGQVERYMATIWNMGSAMVHTARLHDVFKGPALLYAGAWLNAQPVAGAAMARCTTRDGSKPNIRRMYIYGSDCIVKRENGPVKPGYKGIEAIYLGKARDSEAAHAVLLSTPCWRVTSTQRMTIFDGRFTFWRDRLGPASVRSATVTNAPAGNAPISAQRDIPVTVDDGDASDDVSFEIHASAPQAAPAIVATPATGHGKDIARPETTAPVSAPSAQAAAAAATSAPAGATRTRSGRVVRAPPTYGMRTEDWLAAQKALKQDAQIQAQVHHDAQRAAESKLVECKSAETLTGKAESSSAAPATTAANPRAKILGDDSLGHWGEDDVSLAIDSVLSACDEAARAIDLSDCAMVITGPTSHAELMRQAPADIKNWLEAIAIENGKLEAKRVYEAVDESSLPRGTRVIATRYVLNKKLNELREVQFKARLVAKDIRKRVMETPADVQTRIENASPVIRTKNLRTILALAAVFGLALRQFDVNSAFLNAEYKRSDVYVRPPKGFFPAGLVWRLLKPLYGMQDAPREWFECLTKFLEEHGFTRAHHLDECLFYRWTSRRTLFLLGVHVDDNVAAVPKNAEDQRWWAEFMATIDARFGVKDLGTPAWCLGLNMHVSDAAIHVSQETYIAKAIERFGLQDAPIAPTPERTENNALRGEVALWTAAQREKDADEAAARGLTQELYRQLIGTLLYAAIMTRPDIAHAVQLLSRDIVQPTVRHFEAAFRVLTYLKGTAGHGLTYAYAKDAAGSAAPVQIEAYSDSDFAGDHANRKSTSGFVLLINGHIVHWQSRQQSTVTHSSCSAEYVGLSQAARDVVHMQQLLKALGLNVVQPLIKGDNEAAVKIVQSIDHHEKLRSVAVDYHYVKDEHAKGTFAIVWISGVTNVADIFTKALAGPKFGPCRDKLVTQGK